MDYSGLQRTTVVDYIHYTLVGSGLQRTTILSGEWTTVDYSGLHSTILSGEWTTADYSGLHSQYFSGCPLKYCECNPSHTHITITSSSSDNTVRVGFCKTQRKTCTSNEYMTFWATVSHVAWSMCVCDVSVNRHT